MYSTVYSTVCSTVYSTDVYPTVVYSTDLYSTKVYSTDVYTTVVYSIVVYCDGVKAEPRNRQICLARRDNYQADALQRMRDEGKEVQSCGRAVRLGGDPIGELS